MKQMQVAVIGLGFLGRGIAACLLGHGLRVVAYGHSTAEMQEAREHIGQCMREFVEFGGARPALLHDWSANYSELHNLDGLPECDSVIESVLEDFDVKCGVFDKLEHALPPDIPIASNTSSIAISDLQKTRLHPERFVGMHWAEPAHATRFLEIVPGAQTSPATIDATLRLAHVCGKDPGVLSKDVPGFIVNRLAYALYREAISLAESGVADIATIDRSCRNALGLWATIMGPFQWIDLTGGPQMYAKAMKNVLSTLDGSIDVSDAVARLSRSTVSDTSNDARFCRAESSEVESAHELFRRHAWTVRRLMDEYGISQASSTGDAT